MEDSKCRQKQEKWRKEGNRME